MRSDPDPGFKILSIADSDLLFEMRSDPDPGLRIFWDADPVF